MEPERGENIIPFPGGSGMNLERIEEKCVAYLQQARNPLVPVDTLLEFCRRDPECGTLERQDLLDFLRPHGEIEVVEGLSLDTGLDPDTFRAAGIDLGQRAILKTRVPTREQIADMLHGQLKDITQVLVATLNAAREDGDASRITPLETALQRCEALRGKMNRML